METHNPQQPVLTTTGNRRDTTLPSTCGSRSTSSSSFFHSPPATVANQHNPPPPVDPYSPNTPTRLSTLSGMLLNFPTAAPPLSQTHVSGVLIVYDGEGLKSYRISGDSLVMKGVCGGEGRRPEAFLKKEGLPVFLAFVGWIDDGLWIYRSSRSR
ncbi:hypothetical protein L1987_52814 [Smallanthus sonchifolius]|uniref:Uncharacterized protein n=1 Tax=Smallanthus sonchifolius TaxID=185202 RepID=A0ACB9EUG9_9ASTR|nr:hypothetical protein L1987_52814 [Smallanthus sonchifolius]